VTGATSGIGRAAALLYGKHGAKVVVSGRRTEEGEAVAQEIRANGGEATFIRADVSKAEDVKNLIDITLQTYGRLDAAFNNAGTEGQFGPLGDLDETIWDTTININLKGAWLLLKHQIPVMLAQGGGSIVFNGTVVADVGMAGATIYAASKGGVVSLARSAAIEYAGAGIRINVINPGAIETPMGERAFGGIDAFRDFMAPRHPIGRVGTPEEIAEAAVWLTSDAASFVTGQVLNVDGGYTAQ
jgi:NAD(P)-dependent dehydrogenase (short-subunit alcohol dehydrogenase family)